jgi:hypothetical protein
VLPFAARVGKAEIDVLDVVFFDHLHDLFGIGHRKSPSLVKTNSSSRYAPTRGQPRP